ncbi:MAG: N(4)-(Beta-N-acetylglucosaminyl)-L-asparaginase [Gemmatimonadaceae bacterium]|nr:N(4)-(Beta-N-acetylglucosaminyl)-L-asparaginase [Gemmatimonadaceae bacterium]
MTISRREFISAGATAAAGIAVASSASAHTLVPSAPVVPAAPAARPVVIASANGIRGVKTAYEMIVQGADTLDAIIAGVNIQELDPEDQSVGLGGLPNENGVVQLDASCMHGPTKRAGAVGCLEDIATPSLVAKAVMDYTNHIMLVGADARKFAIDMGFKPQNLLTEKSRQDWLRWKARQNANDNWLDHDDDIRIKFTTGTINMNAINAQGDISSVTTTSGIAWKVPGRVGDSPIVGAGQYTDNEVGAAGSTGRGESNIMVCGAFLAVEFMRQGKSPEEALMLVMKRVIEHSEKRLLDPNGRPLFGLTFYAINKKGEYAGACAYEGDMFAVCDARGARVEPCAYLYRKEERPRMPNDA